MRKAWVCEDLTRLRRVGSGTFITAIGVPQVRRLAEMIPFTGVCSWDGVTNVATEWDTVRVVWRTLISAVEFCDGRVEGVVDGMNIFGTKVGGGTEDTLHTWIIAEHMAYHCQMFIGANLICIKTKDQPVGAGLWFC